MEVEHIDPKGGDGLENLCLSCGNCNRHKATAITATDLETGDSVPLFNPRQQSWSSHFTWIENGTIVQGITAIGRATATRFKMNRDALVIARARWIIAGHHPPTD